jgi:hypothetical protein
MTDINAGTATGACGCADCREYRLWRTEGTDEWQPRSEAWDAWSASPVASQTSADSSLDRPAAHWAVTDSTTT